MSSAPVRLEDLLPLGICRSVPDDQKEDAQFVDSLLGDLISLITRVRHGLSLIEFSESQAALIPAKEKLALSRFPTAEPRELERHFRALSELRELSSMYLAWEFMGARDILVSVEDFYRTMTSILSLVKRCPAIRARVDMPALEGVRKKFDEDLFPGHLDLRNAACHMVDYSSKPDRFEKHAMKGEVSIKGAIAVSPPGKTMIQATFTGSTIHYSGYGVNLRMNLTPVIVNNLDSLTRGFFLAFGK